MYKISNNKGFTLLELLVVITIIGVIASVIVTSVSESNKKGRDAARKAQTQEILKAFEIYFSDNGVYPTFNNGSVDSGGLLNTIDISFYGPGNYLNRLPNEASSRYYYCVSASQKTIVINIDTEDDKGGSNFCNITRGQGLTGCDAWITTNASDSCASRF